MIAETLAQELAPASVDFSQLERDHRPLLKLVEQLIGVVPNCDPLLEIWPTGFRSYNLLVPNLLNLPGSLMGQGAPKDLVGLGMYSASRAAECMYCSAHTCSFALRRGVAPEALVGDHSPAEAAVVRVTEGMSRVPAHVTRSDINDLHKHLTEAETEWVILGAALMGFLNKFMDTMGVELEEGAIRDVEDLITSTGWTPGKHAWTEDIDDFDSPLDGRPLRPARPEQTNGDRPLGYTEVPKDGVGTYLRVIRHLPGAARRERGWTKGMSSRREVALLTLEDELGTAYQTLTNLQHKRAVRAIATVVRDNLDPETTTIGLGTKCMIALVYAKAVGNEVLAAEAVQMASRLAPELSSRTLAAVSRFAETDMMTTSVPEGLTSVEAAVVMLTKAAAPSPTEVTQITVASAAHALTPPQIVEAVVWLSVQQLLHRLHVYYEALNDSEY